mmetsp:Transcript_14630/g.22671  ORF Transcript_14630/g.22671 Transcript_14630/m.22671 type:complete len:156 (-) Transcript_14630:422-889(-)
MGSLGLIMEENDEDNEFESISPCPRMQNPNVSSLNDSRKEDNVDMTPTLKISLNPLLESREESKSSSSQMGRKRHHCTDYKKRNRPILAPSEEKVKISSEKTLKRTLSRGGEDLLDFECIQSPVLIVDDNVFNIDALKMILDRRFTFPVDTALDG